MRRAFNVIMRIVSTLIGLLLVLMGGIWILQGLNLAWGALARSFMQGDPALGSLWRNRADHRRLPGHLEQHPAARRLNAPTP